MMLSDSHSSIACEPILVFPILVRRLDLVFLQIFLGHVILGNLMRANFLLVSVPGFFNAHHDIGLQCVSFFQQLINALRSRLFNPGQSLQISRLPA